MSRESRVFLAKTAMTRANITHLIAICSDNASNFSNGQASASFTSTSLTPHLKNETAMFDEVG